MEKKINKVSLLNAYAAADTVVSGDTFTVTGLMPMRISKLVTPVPFVSAVAETVQVATVDGTGSVVISAATRYKILIGNSGPKREGAQNNLISIAHTSPAVLTSATVDRHNVYSALAAKINAIQSIQATAYPVISIAHAAGAFVVGEILTGATSGATGIILAEAANVTTVALLTPTLYVNGENLDDTSGSGPFAATAGPVLGLGLRIVDNAGYWNAKTTRYGKNTIMLTAGFAASDLAFTVAAVYWEGIGTTLLNFVPTKELLTDNLAAGTWDFNVQNLPTAGLTYRRYTFIETKNLNEGEIGATLLGNTEIVQVLYLNDGDADFAAVAAIIAAL